MVKIFRLITLLFEGLLQQFVNGVGILALMAALAAGLLRAPWWSVPVMTVGFGLGARYIFEGWLRFSDKAESASERWGWMLLIYFVITVVGYASGRIARRQLERRGKAAPRPIPQRKGDAQV
jgi:hypothetical protein